MKSTRHTVKVKAITTGGKTTKVSLQLFDWATDITLDPIGGNEVVFWNIGNGKTQLDVTIDPGNGPFDDNAPFLLEKGKQVTRAINPNAPPTTYKYSVQADFGDGESFCYDPRFIIGGGFGLLRHGRKPTRRPRRKPARTQR